MNVPNKRIRHPIKCRLLSAVVAPDTAFLPACLCRLELFGNDPPTGLEYGTCVDQCSTCYPPPKRGNACCGPEPSGKLSNRPSKKNTTKISLCF